MSEDRKNQELQMLEDLFAVPGKQPTAQPETTPAPGVAQPTQPTTPTHPGRSRLDLLMAKPSELTPQEQEQARRMSPHTFLPKAVASAGREVLKRASGGESEFQGTPMYIQRQELLRDLESGKSLNELHPKGYVYNETAKQLRTLIGDTTIPILRKELNGPAAVDTEQLKRDIADQLALSGDYEDPYAEAEKRVNSMMLSYPMYAGFWAGSDKTTEHIYKTGEAAERVVNKYITPVAEKNIIGLGYRYLLKKDPDDIGRVVGNLLKMAMAGGIPKTDLSNPMSAGPSVRNMSVMTAADVIGQELSLPTNYLAAHLITGGEAGSKEAIDFIQTGGWLGDPDARNVISDSIYMSSVSLGGLVPEEDYELVATEYYKNPERQAEIRNSGFIQSTTLGFVGAAMFVEPDPIGITGTALGGTAKWAGKAAKARQATRTPKALAEAAKLVENAPEGARIFDDARQYLMRAGGPDAPTVLNGVAQTWRMQNAVQDTRTYLHVVSREAAEAKTVLTDLEKAYATATPAKRDEIAAQLMTARQEAVNKEWIRLNAERDLATMHLEGVRSLVGRKSSLEGEKLVEAQRKLESKLGEADQRIADFRAEFGKDFDAMEEALTEAAEINATISAAGGRIDEAEIIATRGQKRLEVDAELTAKRLEIAKLNDDIAKLQAAEMAAWQRAGRTEPYMESANIRASRSRLQQLNDEALVLETRATAHTAYVARSVPREIMPTTAVRPKPVDGVAPSKQVTLEWGGYQNAPSLQLADLASVDFGEAKGYQRLKNAIEVGHVPEVTVEIGADGLARIPASDIASRRAMTAVMAAYKEGNLPADAMIKTKLRYLGGSEGLYGAWVPWSWRKAIGAKEALTGAVNAHTAALSRAQRHFAIIGEKALTRYDKAIRTRAATIRAMDGLKSIGLLQDAETALDNSKEAIRAFKTDVVPQHKVELQDIAEGHANVRLAADVRRSFAESLRTASQSITAYNNLKTENLFREFAQDAASMAVRSFNPDDELLAVDPIIYNEVLRKRYGDHLDTFIAEQPQGKIFEQLLTPEAIKSGDPLWLSLDQWAELGKAEETLENFRSYRMIREKGASFGAAMATEMAENPVAQRSELLPGLRRQLRRANARLGLDYPLFGPGPGHVTKYGPGGRNLATALRRATDRFDLAQDELQSWVGGRKGPALRNAARQYLLNTDEPLMRHGTRALSGIYRRTPYWVGGRNALIKYGLEETGPTKPLEALSRMWLGNTLVPDEPTSILLKKEALKLLQQHDEPDEFVNAMEKVTRTIMARAGQKLPPGLIETDTRLDRVYTIMTNAIVDSAIWEDALSDITRMAGGVFSPEQGLALKHFMDYSVGSSVKPTGLVDGMYVFGKEGKWSEDVTAVAREQQAHDLEIGFLLPDVETLALHGPLTEPVRLPKVSSTDDVWDALTRLGLPFTVREFKTGGYAMGGPRGGASYSRRIIEAGKIGDELVRIPEQYMRQYEEHLGRIVKELEPYKQPDYTDPTLLRGIQTLVSLWKQNATTGFGIMPRPKYWTNNFFGDLSQVFWANGLTPTLKAGFASMGAAIPGYGRISNAMLKYNREMIAAGTGAKGGIIRPILGTMYNATFNPNLHAVMSGKNRLFRTNSGQLLSTQQLWDEMMDEGSVFQSVVGEELLNEMTLAQKKNEASAVWSWLFRERNRDVAQHAEMLMVRQRAALYLDQRMHGATAKEAGKAVRDALYDWKHGLSLFETSWLTRVNIPFMRFLSLATRQGFRSAFEPFLVPTLETAGRAVVGQTMTGRARFAAQMTRLGRDYQEYGWDQLTDAQQMSALYSKINASWMEGHPWFSMSPDEYQQRWDIEHGYNAGYTHHNIVGPPLTILEVPNWWGNVALGVASTFGLATAVLPEDIANEVWYSPDEGGRMARPFVSFLGEQWQTAKRGTPGITAGDVRVSPGEAAMFSKMNDIVPGNMFEVRQYKGDTTYNPEAGYQVMGYWPKAFHSLFSFSTLQIPDYLNAAAKNPYWNEQDMRTVMWAGAYIPGASFAGGMPMPGREYVSDEMRQAGWTQRQLEESGAIEKSIAEGDANAQFKRWWNARRASLKPPE